MPASDPATPGSFTVGEYSTVDRSHQPHQALLLRLLDEQNANPTYQPPKRDMLTFLAPEEGQHILEVGCGAGDDARIVASHVGESGRVVGIDLSDFMVEEARRRAAGLPRDIVFTQGDVLSLAFPDNTFDGCRCERVLQHVSDPAQAIREMVRVTKPGGRVVIGDSSWSHPICSDPISEALWRYIGSTIRNPTIGHTLGTLLRSCNLQFMQVRQHYIGAVGQDCTEANAQAIAGVVSSAVNAGAITPDDAAAWPAIYTANGRDGFGFTLIPFFVVVGTKPA